MMRNWICCFPFLVLLFLTLPLHHSMADHAAECDALLQFANSFTISPHASDCNDLPSVTSHPKTASWKNGTDCCSWDGVTCHPTTNQVTGLDLSCSWLSGPLHSNSTLFALRNLRRLSLFNNDFNGSRISPSFGALTRMTHLNLSFSAFSGPVPLKRISLLSNLITLDLSRNAISMEEHGFRRLSQNLTQLSVLVLDGTNMSRIPPISLKNVSSTLTSLRLSGCYLRGKLPVEIFLLPNLKSLCLSDNYDLTGTLPHANWTGPLVSLDLSYTNFHGPIPASVGNLTSMKYLYLFGCGFSGEVPPTLGNLEQLTVLGIGFNYNLTGTFDFEMSARLKNLQMISLWANNNLSILLRSDGNCSFPRLRDLYLSGCKFILLQSDGNCSFPRLRFLDLSGCKLTEFPYFLKSSAELKELDLSRNEIGGRIPEWFWSVVKDRWRVLDLSSNKFTGDISSSICQWNSLQGVYLYGNGLSGTIPMCLGNLTRLVYLELSRNQLQGPLPRSLAMCRGLRGLNVSYNAIHDTFPSWLANATDMQLVDLGSNRFHGVIEVPLPPSLYYLGLSNNNFSGELPMNFLLNSSMFDGIDMSNNSFDGPLPIPPATVGYYLLSNNKFRGGIPHHLMNISATLSVLDLGGNQLSGHIPEMIVPIDNQLETFRLSQNQLEGTLPQSLARCGKLEVLDVNENELEGRFPHWLDTLPNLQVLALRSNKFHGPLNTPSRNDHPFPRLRICDLSNNNFSGPLPTKFLANLIAMKDETMSGLEYMGVMIYPGSYYLNSITMVMKGYDIYMHKILTIYTIIDFSNNFFEGEIPEVIGDLKALKGLNFSHNNLCGKIPSSSGNLTNLEWLDLSSNKLNGNIPRGLADLSMLSCLNLSNNQLVGPIPQGTQFDTFNHSFDGNPGLCGRPLPPCENGTRKPATSHEEEEEQSDKWIEWRALPIGYGCGLLFGISAGYVMLKTGRPTWLMRMIEQATIRITNQSKRHVSLRNHRRRSTRGH